jgi:adenylate cyclase
MNKSGIKRKLTAILCADVKGYSRLMAKDEVGTFQALSACLAEINTIIVNHHGRVFSSPGDAILAQFVSVVDAVECAVMIQRKIEPKNTDVSEDQKMRFRIGVNLGDVIEEEDQIYGDGVNIAARIETLAEPGGVSISRTVYDHVHNKLKFNYEYKGGYQVKNIPEPVEIYRIVSDANTPGQLKRTPKLPKRSLISVYIAVFAIVIMVTTMAIGYFNPQTSEIELAFEKRMVFPLPDKPSIVVLPFEHMSDDPKQEYFSDGITESIIMALSNVRDLFVIARSSSFTYKGKTVKIQQVAEELGVRYVMEGSVQKTENNVRITANLIDTITGKLIWAERYDRDLKDLFALQDDITMKIITALQVELTEGEELNIDGTGTDNLDAYLKLLQAKEQMRIGNKEGNKLCRKLTEEAIALDHRYADAYLTMSIVHLMDIMYGTSESLDESLKLAEEMGLKAIALRGSYANARAHLGRIYLTKRQYDKAITVGERAVTLNPNSAFVNAALAFSLGYAGRPEDAIVLYNKAIRLSPVSDLEHLLGLGDCYRMAGKYEEAILLYKKVIKRSPEDILAHIGAAAAYSLMGREKKAKSEASEILRIDPDFSLESFCKGRLYKNPNDLAREINAIRKAGGPDWLSKGALSHG